uniref:At2g35280-like TPR domain-containing protein n=1 Tax=Davidia involucrata TaxID=16924 RepID=A0A5B7BAW8_DAVIN
MGVRRTKTNRRKIKTTKPSRKLRNPGIKSLSGDLLIEVLSRVASSSFTDLFNAKLCCRDFLGAAEDDYILEHVSIDRFPVIPWFTSGETISFLNRCKESGNPEALYRQGMVEYFSLKKVESGLDYLKRAADKGHAEASYVYDIILLCSEGKSRSKSLRIQICRKRIKALFQEMWVNNNIIPQQHSCCNAKGCIVEGRRWDLGEDVVCCDTCRWYQEVISFCSMLHGRGV